MTSVRQAQEAPPTAASAPPVGGALVALEPRLSIIIPATDAAPWLDGALEAIKPCIGPRDELIVIREPAHAGCGEARNIGAAQARGDVLVFVDADVAAHPDALERIRQRLADDPGLTAIFGTYDDAPAAAGVVSRFRNLLHHYIHSSSPGPTQTFWCRPRRDPPPRVRRDRRLRLRALARRLARGHRDRRPDEPRRDAHRDRPGASAAAT